MVSRIGQMGLISCPRTIGRLGNHINPHRVVSRKVLETVAKVATSDLNRLKEPRQNRLLKIRMSLLSLSRSMKQIYVACAFVIAVSLITTGIAHAQGKSGQGKGRAVGNPHSSGPASRSASANSSSPSDGRTDEGSDLGFGSASTHGQLGTGYSTPMGDSMFLQFYGGVDLDRQTSTDPAGDVNGRVGLGWKF
jgi:hypothetical protein